MPPRKDKPAPPVDEHKTLREILLLLFILAFIGLFVMRVNEILAYWGVSSFSELWARFLAWFLAHLWPWIKIFAVILSALSIWGIYYSFIRLKKVLAAERAYYGPLESVAEEIIDAGGPVEVKNERWEEIIKHINSNNPAEWRQAILEADIMLDELLTNLNYHGDSIGEKLKAVEVGDIQNLDSAWTAHKVRNRIAHDGSNFDLTEREARSTIAHFEAVFREFKVI